MPPNANPSRSKRHLSTFIRAIARAALVAFALCSGLWNETAHGSTWSVALDGSGDFETIQAAMDSAASGDSILVGPGTYRESLDATGKEFFLIGVAGAESTVIDAERRGRVLHAYGGAVVGFALGGGLAASGAGLLASDNPTLIQDNIIEQNHAGLVDDSGNGGGVRLLGGGHTVRSNIIRDNRSLYVGGGLAEGGCGAVTANLIENNMITDNWCRNAGGGLSIGCATLSNNLIARNTSQNTGGGVWVDGVAELRNNTIVGNVANNPLVAGAGIHVAALLQSPFIANNIIAFNNRSGSPVGSTAFGIACHALTRPVFECNDVWGNGTDEFVCESSGQSNFSLDPEFCNDIHRNYAIHPRSPCSAAVNLDCGLVGAFPPTACPETLTTRETWYGIKKRYR